MMGHKMKEDVPIQVRSGWPGLNITVVRKLQIPHRTILR